MSVHWYTDNNNVNTIKQASASNEFCQLLSTHAEIVRQVYQPAISSILHTSLSLAYVNQLPFPSLYRGPTNLIKQISRRFPRDSRRDFKKNPGHVCLALASFREMKYPNTHNMGISSRPSQIEIWGSVISVRAPAENGFWCIWNLKKHI